MDVICFKFFKTLGWRRLALKLDSMTNRRRLEVLAGVGSLNSSIRVISLKAEKYTSVINSKLFVHDRFLVSKEIVVLRPWESETKIGFYETS